MKKLIWVLIVMMPVFLNAQQQNLEGGGFIGFSNYQGDLSENNLYVTKGQPAFGAFLRYHPHKKLAVRGNILYGSIVGDDANSENNKVRDWSFKATLLELGVQGEFHPLGRERTGSTGLFRRQVSPYVATGISFATASADVKVPPADEGLFPEPDDKDSFLTVPVIVGIRFDLLEHLSLGVEWGWRATFSDYLDGVSENGNPDKNDWYIFSGFSVSYFFGETQTMQFGN